MEVVHKIVVEAMSENMLVKKEFFMIEVNTFCEELPSLAEKNVPPEKQTKKETVPAEISICKFTLENGVDEIKHYFIKPGKFPRGFSFLVKDAIEKTYKIDSVQKDDLDCRPDIDDKTCPAENHYKSVVKDILKFLDPSTKNDSNLGRGSLIKQMMFTMPGSVAKCNMSLLWLYKKIFGDAIEIEEVPMRILELPNLFHELAYASVSDQLFKATSAEEKQQVKMKVITPTVAEHFLEKDTFNRVQ